MRSSRPALSRPGAVLLAASAALIAGVAAPPAAADSSPAPATEHPLGWQVPQPSATTAPATLADGVRRREPARVVAVSAGPDGLEVQQTKITGRTAAVDAIAAAQDDPDLVAVGVDERVRIAAPARAGLATDPLRRRQWGMSLLAVESAWALTRGRGVTVAVIDSGVDGSHPDLAGAMTAGINTRTDHGDTAPPTRDGNGHGTHIAGIIAARAGNRLGVIGVAPAARIMPVKVLGADGAGWTSDVVEGIKWATDHGAGVVNLSLGATSADFMAPVIRYAVQRGVTVVAAAGNAGSRRPSYPAAFPGVLSVGALDPSGRVAAYSNRGPTIDLVAPGTNVVSTVPGGYATMSGTSMATPHVAGVAALVRSLSPHADVASVLTRSAVDLGVRGRDDSFGFGRVSPTAAQRLTCATVDCPTPRAAQTQTVRTVRALRVRRGRVLPGHTGQEVRIAAWRSRTPAVCRVTNRGARRVVVGRRVGSCRLSVTAPGSDVLAPLTGIVRVRVTS